MRNAIREYLDLSDDEKQQLFNTATIVFDTNVFLNLYRRSKATREILLDAMQSFQDRLWMPHQVAMEFMKNRPEVIHTMTTGYDAVINGAEKQVDEWARTIDADESSSNKIKKKVTDWIILNRERNLEVTDCHDDLILEIVLDLFEGKVGKEYDITELDRIKKEGKDRYEKNIPPGYKDVKKSNGKDDNNAYGDLIFWLQLLDYAKDNSVDIILVTDDQKEDWWQILHGKTIGPRPELKKEFYSKTHRNFHMYTMKQFIEYSGYNKDEELTCKIEEEVAPKSMPIAEIGLIGLGYKRGTLEMLEQELFELTEKNERRFETLEGYKNLLVNDSITPKQIQEMKNTMAAYKRDGERIKELREKIRNLTIIGLGNL